MPGHVNAALRAYPELWGREAPEPFTTWSSPGTRWTCAREVVMRFLDDVIGALPRCPGDYVHLGGDEVEGWTTRTTCAFMWDACSLALRHGKRPIVWEEAGVARLPEGTIVQHWSDAAPARAAVEQGLPLIMSPGAAHLPGPEVRRDDRARPDLGGRRRGPRRLRVGPGDA